MKRSSTIILACTSAALFIFWLIQDPPASIAGNRYSILPPLVGIVLALITQRLYLSLTVAVVLGGILVEVPSNPFNPNLWFKAGRLTMETLLSAIADETNLMILGFAIAIIMMITVISASGGLQGVVNTLSRKVRDRKSAQWMTFVAGLIVFIDDYANTMIVGSSMRPLTDRWQVSREKLAFLVDSTSAPICGLAIVSTWIGFEVGLFDSVGNTLNIDRGGYMMFFDALSYRFYCVLMLLFILINLLSGKDFGPMRNAELRAKTVAKNTIHDSLNNVRADAATTHIANTREAPAWTALMPVIVLLTTLFFGLWHDGGGFNRLINGGSILDLNYWFHIIQNAHHNIEILFFASLFSLITACLLSVLCANLSLSTLSITLFNALKAGSLPLLILILAWSLKAMCDHLHTGEFLAATAVQLVSPFIFPVIVFLVACVTAFATGTSWGTMAILIPTLIPVAFELNGGHYGLLVIVCMGAVLDGAIFGDHCSPISDTTIMASISSQCHPVNHVKTQLPYALIVALLAIACGYLPVVFDIPVIWSYASATALLVIFFTALPSRVLK